MKKVNTIMEIKHFVECPHCGKSTSRIDHLFNEENKTSSWGPWYCDECGGAYKGEVRDKEVFIEPIYGDRKNKCLVFLKNANVLLVVEGMYFNGDFDPENKRYFYEEHTCPTNYLGVEMVVDLNDGDTDPHGIFEFVGAIPYVDLENVDDVLSLLPGGGK